MKIAILGAGLAGLSASWHLSKAKITLFDPLGIGGKASKIAVGLMHPFVGKHAKKNWQADQAIKASLNLFKEAEKALDVPIFKKTGLERIALTEQQREDFQKTALKHPNEVTWDGKTLFIKEGYVINTPLYLQGLWQALKYRGVELIQDEIVDLNQLKAFDKVIVATGADTSKLLDIPLQKIKGQILEFQNIKKVPIPISSRAYLVEQKEKLIVGATYEHHFLTEKEELSVAKKLLLPKAVELMPELEKQPILSCQAAIRCMHKSRRPLIDRVDEKTFVFTALGSKGLLYHALLSQLL